MFFPTLDAIASRNVLTIDFDATISEAIEKMHVHNHRNIIVTNGTLYYVLTTVDLIGMELNAVDFSNPISSLQLRQVPTMPASENVINAMSFIHKEHEYICVLDTDGSLEGIVTNSDIIASVDPQIMLENTPLSTLFETSYRYPVTGPDDSMVRAIALLQDSGKDCLIVSDRNNLLGIITSKDILRYFKHPDRTAKVSEFMSSPLHTLPASTSITAALAFVQKRQFKRIVVVDDNDGRLVGLVSQKDLIAQSYLRWSSLIKEHYHEIKELSHVLEEQNRQLVKLATKDRLTGVNNRHMFEEEFQRECAYASRYDVPMHLMLFDIDHFKTVNDTHGHIVGDSVLREFAALVAGQARASDCFARWGGEEFVLLMHNIDCEHAVEVADKLRQKVADYPFEGVASITCSVGVCRVDPRATLDVNFAQADEALYRAKALGRNRVSRYECQGS